MSSDMEDVRRKLEERSRDQERERQEDWRKLAVGLAMGTVEIEPDEVLSQLNRFGKGRIFHLMLGHSAGAMSCVGFQTVFLRGTEWAATGKVTPADVPADFPSAGKSSARSVVNKSSK